MGGWVGRWVGRLVGVRTKVAEMGRWVSIKTRGTNVFWGKEQDVPGGEVSVDEASAFQVEHAWKRGWRGWKKMKGVEGIEGDGEGMEEDGGGMEGG